MKYPLTFYVKSLPKGVAQTTFFPVPIISILESIKYDAGVYQHELTHVVQALTFTVMGAVLAAILLMSGTTEYWLMPLILGIGVHPLLYKSSTTYRYWAEVEAYQTQMEYNEPGAIYRYAKCLADPVLYGLDITQDEALKKLRGS